MKKKKKAKTKTIVRSYEFKEPKILKPPRASTLRAIAKALGYKFRLVRGK